MQCIISLLSVVCLSFFANLDFPLVSLEDLQIPRLTFPEDTDDDEYQDSPSSNQHPIQNTILPSEQNSSVNNEKNSDRKLVTCSESESDGMSYLDAAKRGMMYAGAGSSVTDIRSGVSTGGGTKCKCNKQSIAGAWQKHSRRKTVK